MQPCTIDYKYIYVYILNFGPSIKQWIETIYEQNMYVNMKIMVTFLSSSQCQEE